MDYKQKYLLLTKQYDREINKRDNLLEDILDDISGNDTTTHLSYYLVSEIKRILDESTT